MSRLAARLRGTWQRLRRWLAWLWSQLARRRQLRLHRAFGPSRRGRGPGAPGTDEPGTDRLLGVVAAVNRRAAGADMLQRELARIDPVEAERLRRVAAALTERWTRPEAARRLVRRRRELDVRRTLRTNLPRYGGRILTFTYRRPAIWLPVDRRPARLLLIGDVSHSMTSYVGVALFFFHCLHEHFDLDAWIFSSGVTYATPWLDPRQPFAVQLERLAAAAASWGQGTRLGHALETIADAAPLTRETYVVLMTDGEIMLHDGELDRINRWLPWLAARTARITVLTPNATLAERGREYTDLLDRVHTIPVHQVYEWNPQWQLRAARYGSLARHVHELALAATVGDLCRFCEGVADAAGIGPAALLSQTPAPRQGPGPASGIARPPARGPLPASPSRPGRRSSWQL